MSTIETSLTVGVYCLTVGGVLTLFPVPSTAGVICVWLLGLATVTAVAHYGGGGNGGATEQGRNVLQMPEY